MLDREGVNRVLAGMHIAVLPLRVDEPFGLVGLEAAVQRLPVVANARAGFTSLLPQGYPDLLDDLMSDDEIVAAVAAICRDQDACEKWVDQACVQAMEQGDLEKAILPRCMSFIENARSWSVRAPASFGDIGSLLASWQKNRNLSRLVPEASVRVLRRSLLVALPHGDGMAGSCAAECGTRFPRPLGCNSGRSPAGYAARPAGHDLLPRRRFGGGYLWKRPASDTIPAVPHATFPALPEARTARSFASCLGNHS